MKVSYSQEEWYCYSLDEKSSFHYKANRDMNVFKVLFCKLAEWMFRKSQRCYYESNRIWDARPENVQQREEKKEARRKEIRENMVDYDYGKDVPALEEIVREENEIIYKRMG